MKNLDLPFMGCLTERNQDMSTTMPSGEIAQEERSARRLLSAIDDQQQIAPFSEQGPQFDIDAAYRITAEIRRLREARGERVLGRKIGFTNRSIWPEYGVSAPIWGYVYDTTVHALPAPEPFDLSSFVEPRIEPEIVFGLSRAPQPDMDQRALLCGVEWVAHGFEIVQSVYRGWRFATADTVAACGLHGALLIGPRRIVRPAEAEGWFESLPTFRIALKRDDADVANGSGANVLDGPLSALRHLVGLLVDDAINPPLSAGEIVSTGTLTRALPIAPGERWSTKLSGIQLPGISLTLV
jgi:2-oxo-3-hexenedioate decarboxylase